MDITNVFLWATFAFVALTTIRPRLERYAPLSGIALVIATVMSLALTRTFDYFPTAERAFEFFTADPARVGRGALIGGLYGVIFLLWFAGSIFSALDERERGGVRMAPVALAGAIVTAMGFTLGSGILWVAAARAGRPGGIEPGAAQLLYDLNLVMTANVLTVGLAAFIGAAGIGSLRTRLFPNWFGWASLAMTAGLLTPVHYIFEGMAFIWIGAVSILLYRHGGKTSDATSLYKAADPVGAG